MEACSPGHTQSKRPLGVVLGGGAHRRTFTDRRKDEEGDDEHKPNDGEKDDQSKVV